MNVFRFALPLLLTLFLVGCYTSDKPLIAPDEAIFPFKSFTYVTEGDNSPETFVRMGEVYVPKPGPSGGRIELTLKKLPSGNYLAQLMGDQSEKDEAIYLYAVLALDGSGASARAYKVMRRDQDVGPGLRDCPDQRICIDDLGAYLALGEAAAAAGGKPDAIYRITARE